ncbi:MAG TPA: glucans biosynthesis glucosyltransferase MdoH [Stellaceae bacterium]|nr:glucans biosynthesis glucosyltransferase MdoH [Stellaceae bacterium]
MPQPPHLEIGIIVRRTIFFVLSLATSIVAASLMAQVMSANGLSLIGLAVLVLFVASFTWLAQSFWTAVMGFVVRVIGGDPVGLHVTPEQPLRERTAVVMPIYNEDTERVAAGLDSLLAGLADTGMGEHFDVFILSDTTKDAIGARELEAVAALRTAHPGPSRLYYRRRERNIGRKAGNIEDFVRRWGSAYAHMLVLDADSVMSGKTIVRLAQLMEAHPDSGIIQTVAMPVNRETPFARILQFASRLYGPVTSSGLAFWTSRTGNYYGHNAIIRLTAFAENCGLPVLPGAAPLGGEILSHDFVEAALMRRAGYKVFIVPELDGSYEEMPANLIDYAKRDRRWCQGNMQHGRLLGVEGLSMISRLHLFMGVTSYLTSPLWLLLLICSTADAMQRAIVGTVYFKPGFNLFPTWPVATDFQIGLLLAITLASLFLPKVMGLLLVVFSSRARRSYGGLWRLLASVLLETVFSTLLAPVMMLFQTLFVVSTLIGRSVSWDAQPRDDRGLSWREGIVRHVGQSIFGLIWAGAVLWVAPDFFWWLTPVIFGLLLAIPLSVWSSRSALGLWLKRHGLFLTPEETDPPVELRRLREAEARGGWTPGAKPAVATPLVPPEAGLEMHAMQWPDEQPREAALASGG